MLDAFNHFYENGIIQKNVILLQFGFDVTANFFGIDLIFKTFFKKEIYMMHSFEYILLVLKRHCIKQKHNMMNSFGG